MSAATETPSKLEVTQTRLAEVEAEITANDAAIKQSYEQEREAVQRAACACPGRSAYQAGRPAFQAPAKRARLEARRETLEIERDALRVSLLELADHDAEKQLREGVR